ncbi:MAG: CRISPR-associated protein Cas4, partial [Crenarchaeota archaeon]|nr:CRISPR-associated protein Cas4 [Thermoproteota archaeon]
MYSNINYKLWKELLRKLRETSNIVITSVDIKEFVYCPRIIYFTRILGLRMPITERMMYGIEIQDELKKTEERRKTIFKKVKVDGYKIFNKVFKCPEYGLVASVDYFIDKRGIIIPVELKAYDSDNLYKSHEYQVLFQALTIELSTGNVVRECYVYYIESDKIFKIVVNDSKRIELIKLILKIRDLISSENIPEPSRSVRCRCCQFRNIC